MATSAGATRPADQITFAHNSERQFARLLDFYRVEWEYEPTAFPIEWDAAGQPTQHFRPDFYLPGFRLYIEITTLNQRLVTKKNRKVRRLRELYPDVRIKVLYQRDYLSLLAKYGLEPPSQMAAPPPAGRGADGAASPPRGGSAERARRARAGAAGAARDGAGGRARAGGTAGGRRGGAPRGGGRPRVVPDPPRRSRHARGPRAVPAQADLPARSPAPRPRRRRRPADFGLHRWGVAGVRRAVVQSPRPGWVAGRDR